MIYVDLKSILQSHTTCENSDEKSLTGRTQTHIPCGAFIYAKCSHHFFRRPLVIPGESVAEEFLDTAEEISKEISI